jgi:hypothetical protein
VLLLLLQIEDCDLLAKRHKVMLEQQKTAAVAVVAVQSFVGLRVLLQLQELQQPRYSS